MGTPLYLVSVTSTLYWLLFLHQGQHHPALLGVHVVLGLPAKQSNEQAL